MRVRSTKPVITKPIRTFAEALAAAEPRPLPTGTQAEKKNYAERFSRALATLIANLLRPTFPGIIPDETGKRQEQPAATSKGYKKLDIGYRTLELGLGFGVSVKTLNFRDPETKRYTKNYTRVDNELRAEAMDYHKRQPFTVLIAVVFIPLDASDDAGKSSMSSFAQAINVFRGRTGRDSYKGEAEEFERIFIALYDVAPASLALFDVGRDPPRAGRPGPADLISLEEFAEEVTTTFRQRNP